MHCIEQDNSKIKLSTSKKILIIILGFTDNAFFGDALFGWPQLIYVLKKEGIYSNLCENGEEENGTSPVRLVNELNSVSSLSCPENFSAGNFSSYQNEIVNKSMDLFPTCKAQDEKFAFIFTIGVMCYGIPGFLIGYILHYIGLRITRFTAGLMLIASFICLSLTTFENPQWLFAFAILLAVGGNQLRMCSIQFGDLFPEFRSTIITLITGVYGVSASLFIIFSIAQQAGVSRSLVCYVIAVLMFFSNMMSFIMPIHHIPRKNEDCEKNTASKTTNSYAPSLFSSLKTLSSFLVLFWIVVLYLSLNNYPQMYNVWMTAFTCSTAEQQFYSNLFSYTNLFGVFSAPLGGMLTDYLIRRAKKNEANELDLKAEEIKANFIPLFITTICTLTIQASFFFFNSTAIFVSLACLIVARPCVVGNTTAYLRTRFPAEHLNRMVGIYGTVTSCLMFLQYVFFKWALNDYFMAMGVLFGLMCISILNPIHILFKSHIKNSLKNQREDSSSRSQTVDIGKRIFNWIRNLKLQSTRGKFEISNAPVAGKSYETRSENWMNGRNLIKS